MMAKSILLLLCVAASAVAQTATGSIAGTVTDPASAVVPSAKVTLTNRATAEKREMLTSSQGSFLFPLLPGHVLAGGGSGGIQEVRPR